jgi:hypothetical protein
MTLDEVILATTPQQVYDKLVTIYEDYPVIPDDGSLCPLHEYFIEAHAEDAIVYEVKKIDGEDEGVGEIDCGVSLIDVRIGGEYHDLPPWMEGFQRKMMDAQIHTMGEAVAILAKEYGCE